MVLTARCERATPADSPPSGVLQELDAALHEEGVLHLPTVEAAARRRLRVCAAVLAAWTADGADEGGQAERWFDGAVDALQAYAAGDGAPCDTPAPRVRRFAHTPSADDFVHQCLANEPCIFPVDATEPLWRLCAGWVDGDAPNLERLAASCPAETVVVATACNTAGRERTRVPLHEYARWWRDHVTDAAPRALAPEDVLYLKDLCASSLDGFMVPRLFADDWLGGCHDAQQRGDAAPDLRFIYCGPGGACTPLHTDIWDTHSWSVNVCGVKRWRFVAPWDAHLLRDRWGARMAPSLACYAPLFPHVRHARVVELEQRAGEAMFVPSGWAHEVRNETDCLSVNANWANASNVLRLVAHARHEAPAAERGVTSPGDSPRLTPLLFAYLRFAVERELRAGATRDTPLATRWSALTLARAAAVLRAWPELAPGDACGDLARRAEAALAVLLRASDAA